MSCVNLNDSEFFIIGGLINDELPNEKLLYLNPNIQVSVACQVVDGLDF